jgi:spermidine synthase
MPSNVSIEINDARYFIKTTTKKYDLIILDMSAGETMPSNVYTKEAFIEMKKLLHPEGIIVLHFVSNASEEGLVSVSSIGKTFEEAE